MAGSNRIRWKSGDRETLERRAERFNIKIDRILKEDPQAVRYLPEKVDVQEVLESIQTRKDLNKQIKSFERFTRRPGAEKIWTPSEDMKTSNDQGLVITEWERREMAIQLATINRERARERKAYLNTPVNADGRPTGKTRKELPKSETEDMYLPKNFNIKTQKPGKAFDEQRKSLKKQASSLYMDSRKELFKQNYLRALHRVYGTKAGGLIKYISELSPDEVVKKLHEEVDADVEFHYTLETQETKLRVLREIWGDFDPGEYSNTLLYIDLDK